jgi:adhesin transport system outer membrane protein
MNFRQLMMVALLATVGLAPAWSQTSLGELLKAAANEHPSVLQAQSQYQSAGYELESAKWARFPSITSQAMAPNSQTQSVTKVEQPLWTGGRITAQIRVGEANEMAAQYAVRDAQANAMVQVSSVFFDFLRMQQRIEVAEQNVKEHRRLADLIGRRVASEVSPLADDVLANARLQQAITEKIQIQKALESARLNLLQWTNLQVGKVKAPQSVVFVRNQDDQEFVRKSFDFSGQRNKLIQQVESAASQLDVVKAQALPSVVAGVQHIWGGLVPYNQLHNSAYVSLQFQPGAGLSALSNRNAAAMKKDAAQQELLALERNLQSQVMSVLTDIDSSQAQLEPAKALLVGSIEVVASYMRQYQVGRRSWVEVLNAQREMTQAAYNLIDLKVSLQQSQVRLLLLTGDVTPQQYDLIHD